MNGWTETNEQGLPMDRDAQIAAALAQYTTADPGVQSDLIKLVEKAGLISDIADIDPIVGLLESGIGLADIESHLDLGITPAQISIFYELFGEAKDRFELDVHSATALEDVYVRASDLASQTGVHVDDVFEPVFQIYLTGLLAGQARQASQGPSEPLISVA